MIVCGIFEIFVVTPLGIRARLYSRGFSDHNHPPSVILPSPLIPLILLFSFLFASS